MLTRGSSHDRQPVCDRCGDAIGVYEPVVWVLDGSATVTSRAATQELSKPSRRGRVHHLACHPPTSVDATSSDIS
jgi:hypothetical protein